MMEAVPSLNAVMEIRLLTSDDLPAAMELSVQAGWNQLETDWRRLLALCPAGCFGGWVEGNLVAASTVINYAGGPSWIGMVLVDQRQRRRGHGRRIFRHAVAYARESGAPPIGLDATEMGRPLYLEQEFLDVAPTTRWQGIIVNSQVPENVDLVDTHNLTDLVVFDAGACGWRREPLLRQILSEPEAFGLVWRADGGAVRGHAVLRPGRNAWQIGPVAASSPAGLDVLLDAAAARLGPVEIIIDVLSDDLFVQKSLECRGLQPRHHLVRMILGTTDRFPASPQLIAAAGLELG